MHVEGKNCIPSSLYSRVFSWYYDIFMHPGHSRLEITMWQHLTWLGLMNNIKNHINNCHLCKMCKSATKNYEHLLPKNIEDKLLQHTLCVDLIGLHSIADSAPKDYKLWAMTFIDPVTGWFEVAETCTKIAEHISKLLDMIWLC